MSLRHDPPALGGCTSACGLVLAPVVLFAVSARAISVTPRASSQPIPLHMEASRSQDTLQYSRPAWPYKELGGVPDVFLYMAEKDEESTMFDPILFTAAAGFAKAGASVALVTNRDTDTMLQNIESAAQVGKRPVVLVVGFDRVPRGYGKTADWVSSNAKMRGAYIVLYQPEPLDCPTIDHIERHEADEVWDYSLANIEYCKPRLPNVTYRYVPPGYVASYDLNIDLHSPKRTERSVGLLGAASLQRRSEVERYRKLLPGKVEFKHNISGTPALKEYLEEFPIQFNLHRLPGKSSPMDAFRMSQLLSSKGCVISAPAHPKDMARYRDIVHFISENGEAHRLARLGKSSHQCQEDAHLLFMLRFDPFRLLQESGFLAAWRSGAPAEARRARRQGTARFAA
mmetsp:Transcript_44553/g.115845  ORF Transcript_44553/g.115845 Transcript_44553/m.115845 type:complete len:399 (-) Transcript_44553:46-1242(-)